MTVPQPAGRRGRFRLSLAARLGLGFAAIAVVLLLGHAAAQRDMLAAIETLRETQTAQVPLSRAADALTYRVLAFDRAVLAEVRTPAGPSRTGVAEAEAALFASLASYAELQPSASGEVARLRTETQEHTRMGWSLIDVGAQRQTALNGIRDLLDQLTRRISTAFGWDARLPDPALARRAYADLELDLGRLRAAFNGYLVSGPEAPDTLRTATRRLRSTVTAYRDELRRSPGRAWLELVDEDLAQVERLRQEVLRHDASIEALRGRFAESGLQLPLRLDAALAAPASRAVAESAGSAVLATRSAELAIRQLTYLVLAVTLLVSLLTMLAVTRPVKRLTLATRALARGGGQPVRVPPGGPLELDELGEAFNQMAERLAEADQEVSRHQRELEGRVRARTRKLSYLANHDPLSRLPNRRFAFNHLRRAVRAARSRGGGLGLIALDIDNFKVINDNFGHSVGDALLRGVADRLRMLVGERRFIARLGGDEFVITLEDADPSDSTVAMAERIVNGFRAPLNLGGHEILVSVSVGVARLPEHANDASGLARAADAALFRAKALGRNRIATFSHALLEGSETRFMLEQSLRRAVDAGELALVYQPQISLVDGCTDVVEALLRWQRTDGPLVPAGEFIAIAEQSGLIIEVGEWVLETAATAVADWRRRGFDNACVAINVSVHQLLDNRFVDRLTETLARHRLPADAIELELTETAFQTSSSTVESLRRVREGGVGLALDDFGTGYSSLTSLSRLPLRRVKIDRSLVVDAPTSPRAESVARSIIGVCHNLGLGVTVEGIERHDQLAWLAGCGPVHVQGYLIARPMPAADVLGFAGRSAQLLEQLLAAASPHAGGRRTGNPVVPFRHGPGSVDR